MVQLNYRDAKPIYEQIKDGLRKLVVSKALDTGERLPSVRELASQLAINPNTIQRAYRELENEGYIYTVAGKGTFVAENTDIYEKTFVISLVRGISVGIGANGEKSPVNKGGKRQRHLSV